MATVTATRMERTITQANEVRMLAGDMHITLSEIDELLSTVGVTVLYRGAKLATIVLSPDGVDIAQPGECDESPF